MLIKWKLRKNKKKILQKKRNKWKRQNNSLWKGYNKLRKSKLKFIILLKV